MAFVIEGEQQISAPLETVWAALNDPEVLKACIPGCQSLEMSSPTEMAAKVMLKIGPIKATFGGEVTLSNINPPRSYKIAGEGKGGPAGFAKGHADVNLAESDGGTLLTYAATADIGGKIAQLGSRLIYSTAKTLADQFFSAFNREVSARMGGNDTTEEAEGIDAPVPETQPKPGVWKRLVNSFRED